MIFWICLAGILRIMTVADPVINVANPCIFYISDNIAQTRLIDYVTVSDADPDNKPFQCEIRDVNGGKKDEFLFHPNPRKGAGVYNFELAPGQAEIGKFPYKVKIRCEENGGGKKDEVECEVDIIAGDDCSWNPPAPPGPTLDYTTNPAKDAKTTVAGTVLNTITCSTTSGTAMTYTILDVRGNLPSNWNNFFRMDANTGEISVKKDLYDQLTRELGPSWRFDIKAEANIGGKALRCFGFYTLTLTNQNYRPLSYENMVDTVSEMTPVGTILFQIKPWNPEADQTVVVIDWTCDNGGEKYLNIEYPATVDIHGAVLDCDLWTRRGINFCYCTSHNFIAKTKALISFADPCNNEADQTVVVIDWACDNGGEKYLNIEFPGNNIILGSALDFETQPTKYTCTFKLHDGYNPSLYTYKAVLSQSNENEPPWFQHDYYYATFSEGAGFAVTVDPKPVCYDVEGGVTYKLCKTVSGNSSRFRIANSNTGALTLAANYDVDTTWPIRDVIKLCCIDGGDIAGNKLTATTNLVVAINDINDNAPVLTDRGYLWYADNTMTAGTTLLGNLAATDTDLWATNRNTRCSALSPSDPTLEAYFSWSTKCQLFLRKKIDYDPGTLVRFIVTVEDQGSPASLSTTVTVDVIAQDLTTTTTTTTTGATTPYVFWEDTGSCVVFGLTMFGIAALLGVLLYVLIRGWLYGWHNLWPRCTCCRYRRDPVKGPVTPPATPPPRQKTPIIREVPKTPVVREIPKRPILVENPPPPQPILVKRQVHVPRIIQPIRAAFQGIPPSLLRR